MGDIAEFWARWLAFVRGYRDSDIDLRSRLVDRVLASGLDAGLAFCGTDWTDDAANALVDPADRMTCEHDLIAASGAFDESGYVWRNRELHWSLCRHLEGLRHFVRYGWRHLRNPSLEFDVWWYWITYLDPAAEVVNPLVHYLAEGRHLGHAHHPARRTGARAAAPAPRRAAPRLPVRGLRRRWAGSTKPRWPTSAS